jgi:ERCC4-type nuclease
MKFCRDCKEKKSTEEFINSKAFKDGKDTLCILCNRKRIKAWRSMNPEKRAIQSKREYGKSYSQNKHLKSLYGITTQDYNRMFEAQEGTCAICKVHQSELKKRLFVDHEHSSGKIRKLLCHHCNAMLGMARENTEILKEAIKYLETENTDRILT